jgi:hypothetical protein
MRKRKRRLPQRDSKGRFIKRKKARTGRKPSRRRPSKRIVPKPKPTPKPKRAKLPPWSQTQRSRADYLAEWQLPWPDRQSKHRILKGQGDWVYTYDWDFPGLKGEDEARLLLKAILVASEPDWRTRVIIRAGHGDYREGGYGFTYGSPLDYPQGTQQYLDSWQGPVSGVDINDLLADTENEVIFTISLFSFQKVRFP